MDDRMKINYENSHQTLYFSHFFCMKRTCNFVHLSHYCQLHLQCNRDDGNIVQYTKEEGKF